MKLGDMLNVALMINDKLYNINTFISLAKSPVNLLWKITTMMKMVTWI